MPRRIILASSSAYRRELLARLRLAVEVCEPNIDESSRLGEGPCAYVRRLAVAKAMAARQRTQGEQDCALYIGSDQSAELDGVRLEKPGSFEATVAQLEHASGRTVRFLTAVAVVAGGTSRSEVVSTVVRFRELTDAEIRRYVAAEAPYDCAGGFKCEGLGISLFRSIESTDPSALVGLPLIRLSQILRDFGLSVP